MHGCRAFVESQAFFFVSLQQRWFVDDVLLVVMVVLVLVDVVIVDVDVIDDVLVEFGVLELVFFQRFLHFLYCVLNTACFLQFLHYFLWTRLHK